MFRFVLPALIAVTAAAAPASAQDASQPAAEKPAKEKKICKSDTATGSIMAKRTCRTKAEWDAITAQSSADLDRTRAMDRSKSMVAGSR